MMGRTHVTTGLVVGLATLPLAPVTTGPTEAAWVLTLGGTALLPDLDSQHSTASRMWGPITGTLSALVSRISGGHRWGTHDAILGPLSAAALVLLAATHQLAFTIVLALAIGLLIQGLVSTGLGRVGAVLNLIVSVAGAMWLTANGAAELSWLLAVVVAAGMLVHIAGDFPTTGGVPLPVVWLFNRDLRVSMSMFRTDGLLERIVITPALGLIGLWLLVAHLRITDAASLVGWFEGVIAAVQVP